MQQVSHSAPGGAPERATRVRQRQRLIDACISALHLYGPSRTTVEKVVALADLSPGIVRFYFDSKDAMLVASLAHLAAEFEQRVLVPVGALKADPVRALERLVELYFDPEIASPRKVSVWYCFWGEASSREEYYEICGKKDDDFAALVRELIEGLIGDARESRLDADAIALGLIGVLEVLWQTIAFQQEANVDRAAARRRSMAYLRSIFPGRFDPGDAPAAAPQGPAPASPAPRVGAGASGALPAAAYADAALLARERTELLRPSWQLVGHQAEVARPGGFLARDLAGERVLLVRDEAGRLNAFRNACPHRPHALEHREHGHLAGPIRCAAHGLTFGWDGRQLAGNAAGALAALEWMQRGPLIFVRGARPASGAAPTFESSVLHLIEEVSASLTPREVRELAVAADWKLLVESWLDTAAAREPGERGRGRTAIARAVLAPNQLIERTPGALEVLQVIPEAPGRCRLRALRYASARDRRPQRRWPERRLEAEIAEAESTQRGMALGEQNPESLAGAAPELEAFRRAIRALLAAPTAPAQRL